jgi:hypothetical protein
MGREPILLREKRFNYLPYRFLHRGIERKVRAVEKSWDVARRRTGAGHYFRVRCDDDTRFDLFHDVELNAWFVDRRGWLQRWTWGKERLRWIST